MGSFVAILIAIVILGFVGFVIIATALLITGITEDVCKEWKERKRCKNGR